MGSKTYWFLAVLAVAVLYTPPHVPPDSGGPCWTPVDSAGLDRTPTLSHIVTCWDRRSPPESTGVHWNIKLSVVQRRGSSVSAGVRRTEPSGN